MKIYLFLIIFILSCSKVDRPPAERGVVFLSYQGESSVFSQLTVGLTAIEFIKNDGTSVLKVVDKQIDWAFPSAQFLSGLSIARGEYKHIRLYFDYAHSSALIYGSTEAGGVFPDAWLDAQLVGADGYLIPQHRRFNVLEIKLAMPLVVSPSVPSVLTLALSVTDSLTPVSTGEANVLLFSPAVTAFTPSNLRIRGIVERYKNNEVTIKIGEVLLEVDNPNWMVDGVAMDGAGNPATIKEASVEVDISLSAKKRLSYQSINLPTKERYIGLLKRSKNNIFFSGHGVSVDGRVSFVQDISFPTPDESNEGAVDLHNLASGQAVSFMAGDSTKGIIATNLILLSTEVVAKVIAVDKESLTLLPISIDQKQGRAFYARITTENKYADAIKKGDTVRFTGVFSHHESSQLDVLEYQFVERAHGDDVEKAVSIKIVMDAERNIRLSELNEELGVISLGLLSEGARVYATELKTDTLVNVDISNVDASRITQYQVLEDKKGVSTKKTFESFDAAKSYLASVNTDSVLYQLVMRGSYKKPVYRAQSIILCLKPYEAFLEKEHLSSFEDESQLNLDEKKLSAKTESKGNTAITIIGATLLGVSIVGVAALLSKIYQDATKDRLPNDLPSQDEDSDIEPFVERESNPADTPEEQRIVAAESEESSVEVEPIKLKPVPSFVVSSELTANRRLVTALETDESGKQFVVKPLEMALAMDEVLMSQLYKLASVDIAEHKVQELSEKKRTSLGTDKYYAVSAKYVGPPSVVMHVDNTPDQAFDSKLASLMVADLWLGNADSSSNSRKAIFNQDDGVVKLQSFNAEFLRFSSGEFNKSLLHLNIPDDMALHAANVKRWTINSSEMVSAMSKMNEIQLPDIRRIVNENYIGTDTQREYLTDFMVFRKVSLLLATLGINYQKISPDDAAIYFKFRYGKITKKNMEKFSGQEFDLYDLHTAQIKGTEENKKMTDLETLRLVYGEQFLLRIEEMPEFYKDFVKRNIESWISEDKVNINYVSPHTLSMGDDFIGNEKVNIRTYFTKKYGVGFEEKVQEFNLNDVKFFNDHEHIIIDNVKSMHGSWIVGRGTKAANIKKYLDRKYGGRKILLDNYLSKREKQVLDINKINIADMYGEVGSFSQEDGLLVNRGEKVLYLYSDTEPAEIFKFGFSNSGDVQSYLSDSHFEKNNLFYPAVSEHLENQRKRYLYLIKSPGDLANISLADYKNFDNGDQENARRLLRHLPKENIIAATKNIQIVTESVHEMNVRFFEAGWFNNPAYKVTDAAYPALIKRKK